MSVTTEQLIAQAQEAADLTNVADYVTPAQWLAWLNDGKNELHRFVTNKFKATYYRTYDFVLAAGESQITLPSNFWRLKGLDIDADTPRRREVRPFNFAERNRYRQNSLRDLTTFANDRFYSLVGSSILKIQAQEQASGSYRLYYTPKPKTLALVRTIVVLGTDTVAATGGPGGGPLWTLANFGLSYPAQANAGDILTITGTDLGNDGARAIVLATAATAAETDGDATSETFDGTEVATLTTVLDPELEPFSEYVWLTASIKSLVKEESFADAKMLQEQRNLIRLDLLEALETDSGGPATVIDTDGDDDGDW